MDSTAGGYNQSSFQGTSNMGQQFEATRARSAAMLDYQEPDLKRMGLDDKVNETLGTSSALARIGAGAKGFYNKYKDMQGKAQAAKDAISNAVPGSGNSIESPNSKTDAIEDSNNISNTTADERTTNSGVRPVDNTIDDLGGDLMDNTARVRPLNPGGFVENAMARVFGGAKNTTQEVSNMGDAIRGATNNGINGARGAMANAASNVHATVQGAQSTLSGATDDAASMAGKVASAGSKVASGVEDAVNVGTKVMGAASGVMDAMGPVGDLLGLGMAIFSGVESHHHEKIEAHAQSVAQGAMAAPTANIRAAGNAMTTGTLDTSHPGQAVAASHF